MTMDDYESNRTLESANTLVFVVGFHRHLVDWYLKEYKRRPLVMWGLSCLRWMCVMIDKFYSDVVTLDHFNEMFDNGWQCLSDRDWLINLGLSESAAQAFLDEHSTGTE